MEGVDSKFLCNFMQYAYKRYIHGHKPFKATSHKLRQR